MRDGVTKIEGVEREKFITGYDFVLIRTVREVAVGMENETEILQCQRCSRAAEHETKQGTELQNEESRATPTWPIFCTSKLESKLTSYNS